MKSIIILCGPDGVGKSSTAAALVNLIDQRTMQAIDQRTMQAIARLSFAGPLYQVVEAITGLSSANLKRSKALLLREAAAGAQGAHPPACLMNLTIREILQRIATEGLRNGVHQDIWVDIARAKAARVDIAVFDDGRFANELALGWSVELRREGIDYPRTHASSQPVKADYQLDISGMTPEQAAQAIFKKWTFRQIVAAPGQASGGQAAGPGRCETEGCFDVIQ